MSLIEGLEQADGPSRELLLATWFACNPSCQDNAQSYSTWSKETQSSYHRFIRLVDAQAWLDAALTLVPEGMRCRLDILEDGRGACWLWWPTETPEWSTYGHLHATPALALCIAALKTHGGNHD